MRGILACLAGLALLALSACAGQDETTLAGAGCKTHEEGLPFWRQGDFAAAARCWQPRAEAGNARDAMALGMALDRIAAQQITPVPEIPNPTLAEAEQWLNRAARRQLPSAEYELGQFIANHWCYPQHRRCEEARDLFMKAMIGDEERAQLALETLLSTPGLPVLDYQLAYKIIHAWTDRLGRNSDAEKEVDARIRPMIPQDLLQTYSVRIPFVDTPWSDSRLFTGDLRDFKSYIDIAKLTGSNRYRTNFPQHCEAVRRMAESGDLMAMYFYGRMLSSRGPYVSWDGNSCLQGDGDAWLNKAIENGLILGLQGLIDAHYSSCWVTGPFTCIDVLPLYERAIKMGGKYYASQIASLPQMPERFAKRAYFGYVYYFSDRGSKKESFLKSEDGWAIRKYLQLLTEDEKLQIEKEALSFEVDYP